MTQSLSPSLLFLVDRRDPGTVTDWLAHEGGAVEGTVGVLTYQELLRRAELEAAVCVFGDFDRLSPELMTLVRRAWDQLRAQGVRTLNDPHRALDRRALLERLSSLGRNDFRACAVDALPADLRFPVFARRQSEHDGPLTPLLHDHAAVARAVRDLTWPRGPHRRGDLLVVEFCDTSVASGRYTKYAATLVGDRLLPRHQMFSGHWAVKNSNLLIDADALAAEREFMACFPHREFVRETFAIAGIDYGRLDYSLCAGRVQAFEINTNPTQGPRPHPNPQRRAQQKLAQLPRLAFHQQFHAGLRHALRALARTGSVHRVPLRFPARELQRYRLRGLRHTIGAAWRLGFARAFARHAPRARDRA